MLWLCDSLRVASWCFVLMCVYWYASMKIDMSPCASYSWVGGGGASLFCVKAGWRVSALLGGVREGFVDDDGS